MNRTAFRHLLTVGLVALAASCATPPPPPPPPPPKEKPAPPPPPRKVEKPKAKRINVANECRFKNVTGYNGDAKLDVAESKVRHFQARVDIPRRGHCRFEDKDFKQVRYAPHVELASANGCKIRMWEQGRKFTVAFADCNRHCSGSAADYLWPILMDKPTGKCD
ncbi:MAG: hypothetical protein KDH15_13440 [Rhodocyclaceae bacterium]|nr:hypothetical protein [Rhodocyclaceae bacterium]